MKGSPCANTGTVHNIQPDSNIAAAAIVTAGLASITFTRFTSKRGHLSKRYWSADSKINKEAAAQMTDGLAERITCKFHELVTIFEQADGFTAFGWGIYQSARNRMHIITSAEKERAPGNPAEIARTKDNFSYPKVPGVVMFDHDPSEYGSTLTPDELMAVLGEIYPPLLKTARIVRGSVSAGIHLKGEQPKPGKGFHIYIPVVNASDIPRFAKLLEELSWLHGHGFFALAKNGAMLERTIFDTAVFSPERLDFVGKPVIEGDGLAYTTPFTEYTPGEMLNTEGLSVATPNIEAEKAAARAKIQTQANEMRAEYQKNKIAEIVEGGTSYDDAVNQVKSYFNSDCKSLPESWPLYFDRFGKVTVAEACADPDKFDSETLTDPLDGADGEHNKAKFYANKDTNKPCIHSFKHGGQIFVLCPTGAGSDAADDTWKRKLLAHVEKWNKDHASVMVGGKHRIMVETTLDGRAVYEFYPRVELSKLYDNTLIQIGEKAYANYLMAWVKHRKSRTYRGVVFVPGRDAAPGYLNTWAGFSVEPKQNDDRLVRIEWHILHIMCAGNEILYRYLINWIAFTFQHSDKPAGASVVARGPKGCGKGTFGHFLRCIWGRHGLHISSSRALVGNFNAHLADICFLFADEAFYSGDKQHEGVLKALVTEPTVQVERKGIDAVSMPNYLKIFMATNSDFAVPVTRDERRFFVLDVSDARTGSRAYFDALHHDCENPEVQAAFLHKMLNVDLTGFYTGNIPETQGLRDQRYFSMNSVQKWLLDCLINESFEVINGDAQPWQDQMTCNELYAKYEAYCDSGKLHEYRRVAQCKMATYLGKIFEKIKRVGRTDLRGYYFGAVEDARRRFENYEKVNLNELM